jgi:hypothetical protein
MTTEPMTLDDMRDASAYVLADMAQCESPDTNGSPGAKFLISVRDEVVRAIEDRRITLEDFDDHGQSHSIADDAPSIWTHERWRQFVDLGAYNEEPEYDDAWPKDLNQTAAVALYQIADRLTRELCQAWREGWECPVCGEGVEGPSGCTDDEDDGCQNEARHLIRMVAERMDAKAAETAVEALPTRTRGDALTAALAEYVTHPEGPSMEVDDMHVNPPAEAVLTGPVDLPPVHDPILDLIDRAEASDMGIRVTRAAMAHDRAVSRFRRKVWTVAGVLAVLIITAGVILTV